MKNPIKVYARILAIGISLIIGTNDLFAQNPYPCLGCVIDPIEGCKIIQAIEMNGWDECSCRFNQCNCWGYCYMTTESVPLSELESRSVQPLPAGVLLSSVPSPEYLSGLDHASVMGVIEENVFFAEAFAIVIWSEDKAVAYPLETSDIAAIRDCGGSFIARAYRARG